MLTREQKQKIIEELTDKIARQKSLIFTDVTGVNVGEMQDLRRRLREAEVEYKIAKKTLIDLALKKGPTREKTAQEIDTSQFSGTIGLAFGYEDPVIPLKILDNFAKEHKNLKILGGIMEGRALDREEIGELAKIPSREELLTKLISSIKTPVVNFVNILGGSIRNLVGTLEAISNK